MFSRCNLYGLLVTGLIFLNIAVVVLTIFCLSELHASAVRNVETRTQNFALAVVHSVDNEISKIDLSLRAVASKLSGQSALSLTRIKNNRVITETFSSLQRVLPETETWLIADANGTVRFAMNSSETLGDSISGRDYFRKLKASRSDKLVISRALVSLRTGSPVIVLARAIRAPDNRFMGVVLAPLPLSYIEKMLSEFDVGPLGYLALRDRDLGLIVRTARENPESGNAASVDVDNTRASNELTHLIEAGVTKASYHGWRAYDGQRHVASFRRLDNAPFIAVASIAEEQFLADWKLTREKLSGFLMLFVVLGNGAGMLLLRVLRSQQRDAVLLRESNTQLERSLRLLEERDNALSSAQEAGQLGTFTIRLGDGDWQVSDTLRAILGLPREQALSLGMMWSLVHDDDRKPLKTFFQDDVLARHQVFDREYRVRRFGDGKLLWVHALGKLQLDDDGVPTHIRGTVQDISRRKFAEEALWLANQVFEHTSEGIVVLNRNVRIVASNPAFSAITGYAADEVRGARPEAFNVDAQDEAFYHERRRILAETGAWAGESISHRKDGSVYVQYARISAIRNARGEISHYCSVISDISDLKEKERRLEYMAFHDELTGLTNRKLLTDRLQQAIARCRRNVREVIGLCYLDLDNFKAVNDQWGHDTGDALLREIADRLKRCVRAGDTVARLGGDEFVVLLCDLEHRNEVDHAVGRMMQAISMPHQLKGLAMEVTMSVGVVIFPWDETDEPDVLLRHADQAMYEAKRCGRNRVAYFDPDNEREETERHRMSGRLAEALRRNELRLHYQPKVDMRSGAVIGVEALIRWQHPQFGLLLPGQFLPSVESGDLTLPLGEWVIHEALRQQQAWQDAGIRLPVSVNIFPQHLQCPDFAERLEAILMAYPELDPGDLELEILETTDLQDLEEIATHLDACMELGVRFSLDDFGTGFSSLAYLRLLPANTVKIDRSFVRDIVDDVNDEMLVHGMVHIAESLGKAVLAEGVESVEHGAVLLKCGCNFAQGYGISAPLPADELETWLLSWAQPDAWNQAAAAARCKLAMLCE
nr:EAL domain-containing protein [uncultured Propionivibrio sp.]